MLSAMSISLIAACFSGPKALADDDVHVQNLNGSSSTPYMPPPAPAPPRTLTVPSYGANPQKPPIQTPPSMPNNISSLKSLAEKIKNRQTAQIPNPYGGYIAISPVSETQRTPPPPPSAPSMTAPHPLSIHPMQEPTVKLNLPPTPNLANALTQNSESPTTPPPQPTAAEAYKQAGIAPPMSDDELNKSLDEAATGPSLPDATLGGHYNDGLIDGEIARQTEILGKKNDLQTLFLTNLENKQKIRIALEKTKLPVTVYADDKKNGETSQNPYQTTPNMNAPPLQPAPGQAIPAPLTNPITPPTNNTDAESQKKRVHNELPVWFLIRGGPGNYEAGILIPYDGQHYVRKGSRLPEDMIVSDIEPHSVTVRLKNGKTAVLKYGDAVPGYE